MHQILSEAYLRDSEKIRWTLVFKWGCDEDYLCQKNVQKVYKSVNLTVTIDGTLDHDVEVSFYFSTTSLEVKFVQGSRNNFLPVVRNDCLHVRSSSTSTDQKPLGPDRIEPDRSGILELWVQSHPLNSGIISRTNKQLKVVAIWYWVDELDQKWRRPDSRYPRQLNLSLAGEYYYHKQFKSILKRQLIEVQNLLSVYPGLL